MSASFASLIVTPFGAPSEFGSRVFGSRSIASRCRRDAAVRAEAVLAERSRRWRPCTSMPGPPLFDDAVAREHDVAAGVVVARPCRCRSVEGVEPESKPLFVTVLFVTCDVRVAVGRRAEAELDAAAALIAHQVRDDLHAARAVDQQDAVERVRVARRDGRATSLSVIDRARAAAVAADRGVVDGHEVVADRRAARRERDAVGARGIVGARAASRSCRRDCCAPCRTRPTAGCSPGAARSR